MTHIDCTSVPEEVSDFAFDQLKDKLTTEEWEAITVNYDEQIVTINTELSGKFSNTEHPEPYTFEKYIQAIIEANCIEKAGHMRLDAKDEYTNTPYTVAEMDGVRTALVNGCIEIVSDE